MEKKTFGPREVCRLVGLTVRQLGYWKLIGVVRPRQEIHGTRIFHRYTEKDIQFLKDVTHLTREGYPVSKALERVKMGRVVQKGPSSKSILGRGRPAPRKPAGHERGIGLDLEAFEKRVEEEVRRAVRFNFSLACLAIRLEVNPSGREEPAVDQIEEILLSQKRAYDQITRVGRYEYLWLLCQTPRKGAQVVAERLRALTGGGSGQAAPTGTSWTLRMGEAGLESGMDTAADLINRARAGLEKKGDRKGKG